MTAYNSFFYYLIYNFFLSISNKSYLLFSILIYSVTLALL
nr:MAG TPA: hypothetical protein [Bacteriophage sp.]